MLRSNRVLCNRHRTFRFEVVAPVLQGGGALGAYQAGVYEALSEAGIEPNWIAGISIGARYRSLLAELITSDAPKFLWGCVDPQPVQHWA